MPVSVPQPWAQALAALQTKEGEEEEAEERVREGEEDRDESKNKKEVEEKKEEMPYSFPEWVEIEGCCEVEVDVVKMKDSVRTGDGVAVEEGEKAPEGVEEGPVRQQADALAGVDGHGGLRPRAPSLQAQLCALPR